MQIRIVGTGLPGRDCPPGHNFPGYTNVHVAVQSKTCPPELLDLQPGDATEVTWAVDCDVNGADVPGDVLPKAAKSGLLVGRLELTDAKGRPLCASVRPPLIDCSVG